MNKLCIVNYITNDTWHPKGQNRLKESLELVNFNGDLLLLNNENLSCMPHKKVPYAFKLYALKEAQKKGYTKILWVDASFWAIKNVDHILYDLISNRILVQSSGYPLGQWASDICLNKMGVSREKSFSLDLFSGGFIGLNLEDPNVLNFFNEFYRYAIEGTCFKGAWRNQNNEVSKHPKVSGHRHDMTVGSILMNQMGFNIQPNNKYFNYYSWYKKYKSEMDLSKVYFVCEGGPRKLPLQEITIS